VECGTLTVAFSVNAVDRTLEITPDDIFENEGQKYCTLDNIPLPLGNLRHILGQSLPTSVPSHIPVIVCKVNGRTMGLVTDSITGQREIFIKPLAPPLSHLKHTTGGAIMGNGSIVFIMDINTFTSSPP